MDTPDIARLAERARAEGPARASTRSSCPRAATGRCCASCRSRSASEIAVLDPLDGAFDPAPLAEVLADPAVEIVLHAGRQDVAILRRQWQHDVTNVFDTQVAAGFAGFSAQAGYIGLLHDVLRIRLAKSASFTRWDARPLTDEQLRYAREDVEHLLPLADEHPARGWPSAAGSSGRARSAGAIADATDERDPDEVWRRLPRVSGLDPRERAVARELAALARARRRSARTGRSARSCATRRSSSSPSASRAAAASWRRSAASRPDVVRRRGDGHHRGDRARPRGRADPARRGRAPGDRGRRRAGDRARRVARARARAGGRARLRADRRARRPRAGRRLRPARAAPSPTCARCAAGGASSWATELLELLRGERTLGVAPAAACAVSEA